MGRWDRVIEKICEGVKPTMMSKSIENKNKNKLKPCPFCGVVPKIYWESWPEISENSGIYHLEAEHKPNCFIRHINGMNPTGQSSASNKEWLLETWNNRYEGTEEQKDE